MNGTEIQRKLMTEATPEGDADQALVFHDYFMDHDQPHWAASAMDRAMGLRPQDASIRKMRAELLKQLSVDAFGLRFRYVPAGAFLMGSGTGDSDEKPVHAVSLPGYYITETPISWSAYAELMRWQAPPEAAPESVKDPKADEERRSAFMLLHANRIRRQYCETETTNAIDWHHHLAPDERSDEWAEIFKEPPRQHPDRPYEYDVKPMVAVGWEDAQDLARELNAKASTRSLAEGRATFRLPSEAQWEKAARGGLIQCEYPWGDEPPDGRCDCDHPDEYYIAAPRAFPPNGYGLFAMAGGVWEWVEDDYDSFAYELRLQGVSPAEVDEMQKVLRGGAWCDCARAMRVAFRSSRKAGGWRSGSLGGSPMIGFRLAMEISSPP